MNNEPVVTNSALSFLCALLAPIFARRGIDAEGTEQIVSYALTALACATAIWRVKVARSKVTPTWKVPPVEDAPAIPGEYAPGDDAA